MLILLIIPALNSCANVQGASTVFSPRKVDKGDLKSLEESITPVYSFRVSISHQLSDKKEEIIRNVDAQFKEFSACMRIADNGAKVRP